MHTIQDFISPAPEAVDDIILANLQGDLGISTVVSVQEGRGWQQVVSVRNASDTHGFLLSDELLFATMLRKEV